MKHLFAHDLVLEPLVGEHANEMFGLLQDSRIYEFIPDEPPESLKSLEERYRFLEGAKSPDRKEHWLNWVIFLSQTRQPIRTVQATVRPGDTADIAYIILPEHWDKRFGRSATAAMLDFIFEEFALKKAVANVDTRNARSIRMLDALQFRQVSRLKDADFFKGASSDEFVYEMEAERWMALRER